MRSICGAGSLRLITQSKAASKITMPAKARAGAVRDGNGSAIAATNAAIASRRTSIADGRTALHFRSISSMRYWPAAPDFLDDLVSRHALDFGAGFQHHAMA